MELPAAVVTLIVPPLERFIPGPAFVCTVSELKVSVPMFELLVSMPALPAPVVVTFAPAVKFIVVPVAWACIRSTENRYHDAEAASGHRHRRRYR